MILGLQGLTIRNGYFDHGGAVISYEYVPPIIENCIFEHNTATSGGGAIANIGGSPRLVGCRFIGNSAGRGGAVANFSNGQLEMDLCVFQDNAAAEEGGALFVDSIGTVAVDSCTFADNAAPRGSAISVAGAGQDTVTIRGCIVADGLDGEGVYWDGGGLLKVRFSDLSGNAGGDWVGAIADQLGDDGNLQADPMFCRALNPDEPLTLAAGSPCAAENNPVWGRLGALPVGCVVTGVPGLARREAGFRLHPCFPNPFNPSTVVGFDLPRISRVDLSIHDVAGRLVRVLARDEILPAGRHDIVWDGRTDAGRIAAAGIYYCRLEAGDSREIGRMTLIK